MYSMIYLYKIRIRLWVNIFMVLFMRIERHHTYWFIDSFNKLGTCFIPDNFLSTRPVSVNERAHSFPSRILQNWEVRRQQTSKEKEHYKTWKLLWSKWTGVNKRGKRAFENLTRRGEERTPDRGNSTGDWERPAGPWVTQGRDSSVPRSREWILFQNLEVLEIW